MNVTPQAAATGAGGAGGAGAYTAAVESIAADGPSTRITLVVPETYGTVWAEFRIGNTVSLIDAPDLPGSIDHARNIDL